jgi:hypothetical protein
LTEWVSLDEGDQMITRPEHEFHVVNNEIVIDFAVPLPGTGEDEVLTELLSHHGAEIIRDRIDRGQPLDGIPVARIRARRGAAAEEIAVLDLDADEVPDIDLPQLLPARLAAGYDLLARLGEGEETEVLRLSSRRRGDELIPLHEELRLTKGLMAGLRSLGIDPESMSMSQFAPGLLRLAGYQLTERADGAYTAIGGGSSTYVEIVEHRSGEYPELDESRLTPFLISYSASHTEHGLLISDKYGPYEIYARERANPRCHFIMRERLQAFVDAIALG